MDKRKAITFAKSKDKSDADVCWRRQPQNSQAGFLKILECYTKEVSHTEIKANIIALEDYIEDQDSKQALLQV